MSKSLKALTIADILEIEDRQTKMVECPEWGGVVYVRTMSANERDAFELKFANRDNQVGMRAGLVAAAMCDCDGNKIKITDAEVKALGSKASGPLDRLFNAIMELNKMNADDLEEAEKNSEPTTDDDSG
jgi:hypothetical protein